MRSIETLIHYGPPPLCNQQEAESATGPSQVGATGVTVAAVPAHTVVDIQCGECDNGRETAPTRVAELQAVTLNDSVLLEREQGILSINRTVRTRYHTRGGLGLGGQRGLESGGGAAGGDDER
jgi:hypothetical protein